MTTTGAGSRVTVSAQLARAVTVSGQLDLAGWQDAYLTELRNAKGEWVHDLDAIMARTRPAQAKTLRRGDHVMMPGSGGEKRPFEVLSARHAGKKTTLTVKDPDTGETSQKSVLHGTHVALMPKGAERGPAPAPPIPAHRATAARPPAAQPPAGETARSQAEPSKPVPGKALTGMDLWMSGEGVTPDVTTEEARTARSVWYSNTFSYTNNYLRKGTLPSVSSKNAINDLHGGYGAGYLVLPTFANNDADYLKGIGTLKGMIDRAPKFSRPATMYRDVSSPDQVFGPVGSMKGRVFSDPGFMSATADPASAERYGGEDKGEVPDKIVMHIPAGGGGMRAQYQFSPDNAREKEFTFAPGTKWRVDDDTMVNGKRQTTVTQIIPPAAKPGPVPKPVIPQIRTTQSWDAGGAGHRVNVETGERLS